jgi:hypothetical protein
MLNFERLWLVVNKFLETFNENDFNNGSAINIPLPTPDMIAEDEKIFMPPNHLARRAISFGSLSRAKLSPEELSELIDIFENEKYILVVGQDLKNKRIKWDWIGDKGIESDHESFLKQLRIEAQENCHIVLHADANNGDIVKSTLALATLRRKLAKEVPSISSYSSEVNGDFDKKAMAKIDHTLRSRDCMHLIRETRVETDKLFGPFLKVLAVKGWATPARFMFGRVSMRTEWPIKG